MNEDYLLSPTVTSGDNATVFYYIHVTFLLSTCHYCVYATALKPKFSFNATMVFVSFAY